MLREQRLVIDTLNYFNNLNYPKNQYRIYIVTTQKELAQKTVNKKLISKLAEDISSHVCLEDILERYSGLFNSEMLGRFYSRYKGEKKEHLREKLASEYEHYPSTYQLAIQQAQLINTKEEEDIVQVINYPYREGVMSHQINYLLDVLDKKGFRNAYFAVYNADSRPHVDTLSAIATEILKYKIDRGQIPNVVQQSSLFTNNYNHLNWLLKAAAIFQTKWTLVHELTRFRSQSKKVVRKSETIGGKIWNTELSHCVGHGLFVKLEHLMRYKLPTETVNEDLPFGFYQCAMGEPILPVSLLENSDSPETIKSLINQKKVWFWPYIEYWKCRRIALNTNTYRDRTELDILTYKGIWTGVTWLFHSLIFLTPLIIGLLSLDKLLVFAWFLSWTIYWILPVTMIYTDLPGLERQASGQISQRSLTDLLVLYLSGSIYVFIHSVGPIQCTYEFIQIKRGKVKLSKEKTER